MDAYDKTSIQINRCKRILALVDDYVAKMNAGARTTLRMALMEEFEAPAIAPPVAAGSVDTLERFDLIMGFHGREMEPDENGEWVKHTDAIAWGAQQREAGRREMFAEVQEENAILAAKVEKAEAELKNALGEIEVRKTSISFWIARVKELESEVVDLKFEIAHPGNAA